MGVLQEAAARKGWLHERFQLPRPRKVKESGPQPPTGQQAAAAVGTPGADEQAAEEGTNAAEEQAARAAERSSGRRRSSGDGRSNDSTADSSGSKEHRPRRLVVKGDVVPMDALLSLFETPVVSKHSSECDMVRWWICHTAAAVTYAAQLSPAPMDVDDLQDQVEAFLTTKYPYCNVQQPESEQEQVAAASLDKCRCTMQDIVKFKERRVSSMSQVMTYQCLSAGTV